MMGLKNSKSVTRLLDANFNRAKEGLRVCEDICRFILDEATLTRAYKNIRHEITDIFFSLGKDAQLRVMEGRDAKGDVGRTSTISEFKRGNIADIFYANSQRVKESVRVLEEFFKLNSNRRAEDMKKIRYRLYALEKKVVGSF